MAKKSRNTLKNYFTGGSLPTEHQFADLIDSTINVIDEGFDKTAEQGFKVAQLGDTGYLISFFENIAVEKPLWSLKVDLHTKSLIFEPLGASRPSPEDGSVPALALAPDGGVGIRNSHPHYALDVGGTVAAQGRIGRAGAMAAPADGEWHDITETLEGCHAFEVMAGVGAKGTGKYALVHAFALNTFGDKSSVTYHHAHYGSRCNRIRLRWCKEKDSHKYRLQLKTGCTYGEGVNVRYYLTDLWFDHFMDGCQDAGQKDGGK